MRVKQQVSADEYKRVIETAFTRHYQEGTDVWSQDDSLVTATRQALQVYGEASKRRPEVLDIGCGNGRHSLYLNTAASYTGIDLVEHESWREVLREASLPLRLLQTDFLTWAKEQQREYDLILDNGCFHHQHPDEHVVYLAEAVRLLRPDGLASFVVWGEEFESGDVDGYGRYHFHFTPESLEDLLRAHGFEPIRLFTSHGRIGKRQLQMVARKK